MSGVRRERGILIAAMISICATPCNANDSASEVAVGGLVMVKTDVITMQREDLTLSLNQVRVRYEMRNDRDAPVTLQVAFPMPEVPIDGPGGMDIVSPDGKERAHMIDWPQFSGPNFLGFRVSIDGKSIEPEIEIRSDLPDGRNIVDALRQIGGWWLVLHPRMYLENPSLQSSESDRDIGPSMLRQLRELRAIEGDDPIWPLWRTHITFHWMQTFKPGVTIVEHWYRPLVGHFMFSRHDGKWDDLATADPNKFEADYCIDDAKSHVLQTMVRPSTGEYLTWDSLGYILSTGANWAGPIGTFHLVVDGEHALLGSGKIGAILLCSDLPLEQVGPLHIEGTVQNYVPKADLKVLMVLEPPK